jgi:hypothetical protein
MKKALVVINGLLLAVVIGAVFQSYRAWTAFGISHGPDAIRYEGEAFGSPLVPDTEEGAGNQDWTLVSDQNLFSFDRNDLAIAAPVTPVATGPMPVLFGTMSLGEGPVALLAAGEGGARDSRPYSVGQTIGGWLLVEVANKSVVVESGGIRTTILMNDPTAQVPRGTGRTIAAGSATPQVSTVGAASPGSTVQSSVAGTARATRPASPTPSAITEDNVPPGFRIQRTPGFGNIVVPIPEP